MYPFIIKGIFFNFQFFATFFIFLKPDSEAPVTSITRTTGIEVRIEIQAKRLMKSKHNLLRNKTTEKNSATKFTIKKNRKFSQVKKINSLYIYILCKHFLHFLKHLAFILVHFERETCILPTFFLTVFKSEVMPNCRRFNLKTIHN